ncbi:SDR family NAD(P)-dependent oxidoreductase [Rhizobium johnstonii]
MDRLNGKVAVVTGASRGIGRATAKLFAAEGAKVAVLSRTSEGVERVVADIVEAGGTALGVVCDVGEADQITAAVDKVVATYGRIDILVNNAFDGSAVLSSVIDLSVEQLQRNFDTGPIAYLRFMQACYPHLREGGEGRIINFGSMAGTIGLAGYGPCNIGPAINAALDGAGLSYVPRDLVRQYCDSGQLHEVLADWAPTFQGYHLYYPSRRHPSPAFSAFVEAFRYRYR